MKGGKIEFFPNINKEFAHKIMYQVIWKFLIIVPNKKSSLRKSALVLVLKQFNPY
jgi:hypothetical protein